LFVIIRKGDLKSAPVDAPGSASADERVSTEHTCCERLRVEIQGAVQGVGFRPFVYRLATALGLAGWVINDSQGVFVEVEGARPVLETFLARLPAEKPPRSIIQSFEAVWLPVAGYERFEIRHSDNQGAKTVLVLPDIATCPDCLAEILNPADRRYRYPFTNCTNCGPRFSIIQALPYDRPNTTMQRFTMCPVCKEEYENPLDRRFHAQPNACPTCGPQLAFYAGGASPEERLPSPAAMGDAALMAAVDALRAGRILAIKGLGGFHLMVDARNEAAVARLRERKPRRDRAFAIMARDLAQALVLCEVSPEAAALLTSPEAPIVLMKKKGEVIVAPNVAPNNPMLGVMLPYTPLHHLLMREIGFPVVATSGNLTDEPICTDEAEAMTRLAHVADVFLVHDRPIQRHVDDSVAWVVLGQPRLLRRARGYAPLPVLLPHPMPTVLAVGAHLKNTVALSVGRQVFISQHIGDLETPEAMAAFERVITDFLRLYEAQPAIIAHDLHPDYLSSRWAREQGGRWGGEMPLVAVQHHHAHLAACLAENGVDGPALGVVWDGTGLGTDGTIWGGEFLLGDAAGFTRAGHLRPFRLPGGEAAIREPGRLALALLWELYGEAALGWDDLAPVRAYRASERRVLGQMLARGVNAPLTTSAGRLFDAVSALIGLRQEVSFEGQAAMALEYAADSTETGSYPFALIEREPGSPLVLDWAPLVGALLGDLRAGIETGIMAARFHNGLVDAIVSVAQKVGERRVALSGGCFQNRLLTERAAQRLAAAGFEVLLHRQTPPNDGCISLGQTAVAAAALARSEQHR
jgi:hydrogenase maturation protein HypF